MIKTLLCFATVIIFSNFLYMVNVEFETLEQVELKNILKL
jgi:hypothetical protein